MDRVLEELFPYFPERLTARLKSLSEYDQGQVREIRLKQNCPPAVQIGSRRIFFREMYLSEADISGVFRLLCGSSAYTYQEQIRSGFLTVSGGHRVGLMGTAVCGSSGCVESMRGIYGMLFRVARDYPAPVDRLLPCLFQGDTVRNLLIAGPPCSGKTTVLRSLARRLAEEYPVAVIDEREELFPCRNAIPWGCDILWGYPKALGILQALRVLSPRMIVCDEVGSAEEVEAMEDGIRSGVSLILSAHSASVSDLLRRPPLRRLILNGGIDSVVFLDRKRVGEVLQIVDGEEIRIASSGMRGDFSDLHGNGSRGSFRETDSKKAVDCGISSDYISGSGDLLHLRGAG